MSKHATVSKNYYPNIFGLQLGVLLVGLPLFRLFVTNEGLYLNIYQSVAVLWPMVFIKSLKYWLYEFFSSEKFFLIAIFFSFAILSSVKSLNPVLSLGHIIVLLFVFFQIFVYSSTICSGTKRHYYIYLFFGILFCAVMITKGQYTLQNRLGGPLNPNSIGMLLTSLMLCCLLVRIILVKYLLFAVFFSLLLQTGSRSSLLALLIGLFVYNGLRFQLKKINYLHIAMFFGAAIVLVIMCLYYSDVFSQKVIDTFDIHDKYRGLDSGATGRVLAWQEAWRLFVDNPFFGVGFRAHEYLMTSVSSSHNGYLALLAEVGIIGFSAVIVFVSTGIYRLVKLKMNSVETNMVSCIAAYLFISIFERYLFNVGNSFSLLFIYCLFAGLIRKKGDNIEKKVKSIHFRKNFTSFLG